jgi:hypothetical protein
VSREQIKRQISHDCDGNSCQTSRIYQVSILIGSQSTLKLPTTLGSFIASVYACKTTNMEIPSMVFLVLL